VFRKLTPEPLFAEGAAKTHFSWHMLTGGNAFDVFRPEALKAETLRHPFREAPRMRDNFTRLNFGWLGYWLPDEQTVGTQPDQLEFVTSKAAAWDCPVSIHANPATLAQHPRTADNFEVFRRWEQVRARKWLTEEHKERLRDPDQEFTLLLDEHGQFELVACERVEGAAGGSREVIAYTFERLGAVYAMYWHICADAQLQLPLPPDRLEVQENLGERAAAAATDGIGTARAPLGKRRYLKAKGLSRAELVAAVQKGRVA
jgi:hypothetical protein